MKNVVIYIHGKGGSAAESEHYKQLFPDFEVIGLDYQTFSPWDTGKEIYNAIEKLKGKYENVILIANSIGAFFNLMSIETITEFALKHQATLTVMEGGEHWFHTEEQMLFLDNWIKEKNV